MFPAGVGRLPVPVVHSHVTDRIWSGKVSSNDGTMSAIEKSMLVCNALLTKILCI